MNKPTDAEAEKILEALNRAVCKALDRKRRLGQYAVMWRNGRVVRVPPDELPCYGEGKEDVGKAG